MNKDYHDCEVGNYATCKGEIKNYRAIYIGRDGLCVQHLRPWVELCDTHKKIFENHYKFEEVKE